MNDIEFDFLIETEAGEFEVPMSFSASEWFDGSGDIPTLHYTDIGFDQRQKTIIHDLIGQVGTEYDGGLLGQMQNAADWWKSHQGPDSVWHDYFTNDQ
jgi:hypothetical protein